MCLCYFLRKLHSWSSPKLLWFSATLSLNWNFWNQKTMISYSSNPFLHLWFSLFSLSGLAFNSNLFSASSLLDMALSFVSVSPWSFSPSSSFSHSCQHVPFLGDVPQTTCEPNCTIICWGLQTGFLSFHNAPPPSLLLGRKLYSSQKDSLIVLKRPLLLLGPWLFLISSLEVVLFCCIFLNFMHLLTISSFMPFFVSSIFFLF